MITLTNVNKIYGEGTDTVHAVDDVSLTIAEGEIYGIIGYSGAGKSTVLRMLNGIEAPTSGQIYIDKEDINKLSGPALRSKRQNIGMIFQHFNLLWSRTVRENILFPLEIAKVPKDERELRADELIDLVGLTGRENSYPSQLSGGQKQRVGIARALANNPKLLLCDEATSSLDPQTTNDVLDLLVDINQKLNLTIVVITHEMNVIRKICNRVSVMENGKVVEEGQVIDVFKNPTQNITKHFIEEDAQTDADNIMEILKELKERNSDSQILHLKFDGIDSQQPIISKVSRLHEVDVNIIQGNIQSTVDTFIGSLYVQIIGEENNIKNAMREFKKLNVEMEVIEYED